MKGLNEFKNKANEDMDPTKIEQIEGLLDGDIHSELSGIISNIQTILADNDLTPEDIVMYLKHKIESIAKPEGGEEKSEDEGSEGEEEKSEDEASEEGEESKEESTEGDGEKPKEGEESEDEKAKGGLADGMSLDDIASKHSVDVDVIKKEFIMGIKVEMEHTEDEELAKEIAKDHLVEDPKYYTKLANTEESDKPKEGEEESVKESHKVGDKYHAPAPEGGEAIDFVITKIEGDKYTILTSNEDGDKNYHTFSKKVLDDLIKDSKKKH